MNTRQRNYSEEYRRRIERGLARNLSRSQARGHPRAGEMPLTTSAPISRDDPREKALKMMKQGFSQKAAAKFFGISAERLRRYLKESTLAKRAGNKWIIRDVRAQGYWVASNGKILSIALPNDEGSRVGKYWVQVNRFLETNDASHLITFKGAEVRDVNGKRHVFETNPNILRKLDSAGEIEFLEIYADVAA